MSGRDETALSQEGMLPELERVLHSNTFRNSDALRRLLRFLAEKSHSGEADQLKEYSIAIDALGKPSTYDPRNDSTVRIQVGRLRQKLAEYYRIEGHDSQWVLELPKGRFKLTCEPRPTPGDISVDTASPAVRAGALVASVERPAARLGVIVLGLTLLISVAWAGYATLQLFRERQDT